MSDKVKTAEQDTVDFLDDADKKGGVKELTPSVTLTTGVVLKGKQVPPFIMMKVLNRYQPPKIPQYYNDELQKWLDNPADPDYMNRYQLYEARVSEIMLNAFIVLGTELKEKPKGVPGPNSEEWVQRLVDIGLEVNPSSKNWRYLNWVLTIAAATDEDTELLLEVIGSLSGVPEKDVENAAATFPGKKK